MMNASRAAVVVALAATALLAPWLMGAAARKSAHPATMAEDKIERGRYLVGILGCGDCHTPGTMYGAPDHSRMLSGSELGWQGPWGVTYPQNLTPDKETGIGSWTEDQIVAAIRTGQRPDGTQMRPPMPWPNYVGMKEADARAVAAYLKSLPAVSHKVPEALGPGETATGGSVIVMPPPSAWDAPHGEAGK